jgi:predicted N-formylglutamate amidohydrolase
VVDGRRFAVRATAVRDQTHVLAGTPVFGGLLVVADHASDRVPSDIDLGMDPALLSTHIAVDIGVGGVAREMAQRPGTASWIANVSRLVCDFNREEHEDAVVPASSDGHASPGNAGGADVRAQRVARFHRPYHEGLAALIGAFRPSLICNLHSFTPQLASNPAEERPWQAGVLYNADDRGARLAIPLLEAEGLTVGDQLPYSGKLLNATMNRHAEAGGIPYLGIEIRQDQIAQPAQQADWAARMLRVCETLCAQLA